MIKTATSITANCVSIGFYFICDDATNEYLQRTLSALQASYKSAAKSCSSEEPFDADALNIIEI